MTRVGVEGLEERAAVAGPAQPAGRGRGAASCSPRGRRWWSTTGRRRGTAKADVGVGVVRHPRARHPDRRGTGAHEVDRGLAGTAGGVGAPPRRHRPRGADGAQERDPLAAVRDADADGGAVRGVDDAVLEMVDGRIRAAVQLRGSIVRGPDARSRVRSWLGAGSASATGAVEAATPDSITPSADRVRNVAVRRRMVIPRSWTLQVRTAQRATGADGAPEPGVGRVSRVSSRRGAPRTSG